MQGATTLCTITLPGSSCTTTATALGGGTFSVNAVYSGDANFLASTSPAQNLTVDKASLTVTASSASMTFGATVATVTPGYSGFVSGETSANLPTQPTCSTAATSTSKLF